MTIHEYVLLFRWIYFINHFLAIVKKTEFRVSSGVILARMKIALRLLLWNTMTSFDRRVDVFLSKTCNQKPKPVYIARYLCKRCDFPFILYICFAKKCPRK